MSPRESLSSQEAHHRGVLSLVALGATALVGLGLMAERIKSGDIAGGVGVGVGTLAVLGVGGAVLDRQNQQNIQKSQQSN